MLQDHSSKQGCTGSCALWIRYGDLNFVIWAWPVNDFIPIPFNNCVILYKIIGNLLGNCVHLNRPHPIDVLLFSISVYHFLKCFLFVLIWFLFYSILIFRRTEQSLAFAWYAIKCMNVSTRTSWKITTIRIRVKVMNISRNWRNVKNLQKRRSIFHNN